MRRTFADLLLNEMRINKKIHIVSCDLGYKVWDKIIDEFPDRFHNPMAAEMTGLGMCIGMTYNGIIPIFYSIFNFAIYRNIDLIRNYVNYEKTPVKIVCSGRDLDYAHDGISHQSEDGKYFLDGFKNIKQYWPQTKDEITQEYIKEFINNKSPSFLSLKR